MSQSTAPVEWDAYPEPGVLRSLRIDPRTGEDSYGHTYERLNEAYVGVWRCHVCEERVSGAGYRARVKPPEMPHEAVRYVYVCPDHETHHLRPALHLPDREEEAVAV